MTDASLSALLELSLTLRSYRDALVLVGGWAPFFLIDEFGRGGFDHVGSIDIDIAVDPELVENDGYSAIVDLIQDRGYSMRHGSDGQPIRFSFERNIVSRSDGRDYLISVDFLTCRSADSGSHRHRKVQSTLPARIANGCDIAFIHNYSKEIRGTLPDNGTSSASILMLDIAGCIGMKGVVLGERYKEKDAYDIFSVISQCLADPNEVSLTVKPFIAERSMAVGMDNIRQKFQSIESDGPSWVGNFMFSSDLLQKERAQAESYVLVRQFLKGIDG
ncbi:MAG TPA: hypothetical protein VGK23_03130 [Methanomassiliicoccales archaeon]